MRTVRGLPPTMSSSRAQISGHVAEPERPGRGGRELGVEVVGRGEDDADEVLVVDAVAFEHRRAPAPASCASISSRVSTSHVVAPRSARTFIGGRGYPVPSATTAPYERPHLVAGERAPRPRARGPDPRSGRSGCARAAAPGGRPPRTCAGPAGSGPRGSRSRAPSCRRRHRTRARTRAGAVTPSSSSTPSRRRAQRGPRRHAVDLGEVLLLHAEARVGEPLGEVAVVGEQRAGPRCPSRAGRPGTPAARPARGPPPSAGPRGRTRSRSRRSGLLSR